MQCGKKIEELMMAHKSNGILFKLLIYFLLLKQLCIFPTKGVEVSFACEYFKSIHLHKKALDS